MISFSRTFLLLKVCTFVTVNSTLKYVWSITIDKDTDCRHKVYKSLTQILCKTHRCLFDLQTQYLPVRTDGIKKERKSASSTSKMELSDKIICFVDQRKNLGGICLPLVR
jgi:hypothetical protein